MALIPLTFEKAFLGPHWSCWESKHVSWCSCRPSGSHQQDTHRHLSAKFGRFFAEISAVQSAPNHPDYQLWHVSEASWYHVFISTRHNASQVDLQISKVLLHPAQFKKGSTTSAFSQYFAAIIYCNNFVPKAHSELRPNWTSTKIVLTVRWTQRLIMHTIVSSSTIPWCLQSTCYCNITYQDGQISYNSQTLCTT